MKISNLSLKLNDLVLRRLLGSCALMVLLMLLTGGTNLNAQQVISVDQTITALEQADLADGIEAVTILKSEIPNLKNAYYATSDTNEQSQIQKKIKIYRSIVLSIVVDNKNIKDAIEINVLPNSNEISSESNALLTDIIDLLEG